MVWWTNPDTHFWSVFIVISIYFRHSGSTPRFGTVRTLSGMIFVSAQELSGVERFHSRVQQLCKFIGTKESFSVGLEHQHGRRFIVLEHQYGGLNVTWKRSRV